MDIQCDLKPIVSSNSLFNYTNSLITCQDWTEQSSYSLEQYCESYKSVFCELKSICNSILWMILSTWSHIYIDCGLLISKMTDVILFFIKVIYSSFEGRNCLSSFCDLFCSRKTDNSILYIWLNESDGSRLDVLFCLIHTGCLILRLIWRKIYMTDKIVYGVRISICML